MVTVHGFKGRRFSVQRFHFYPWTAFVTRSSMLSFSLTLNGYIYYNRSQVIRRLQGQRLLMPVWYAFPRRAWEREQIVLLSGIAV